MGTRSWRFLLAFTAGLVVAGGALYLITRSGFSARERPSAFEAFVARRLRFLGVPAREGRAVNAVTATAEVLGRARAHFSDHCAMCHANDGSGETSLGRSLYPKVPDMRQKATQELSDGQIFWIIKNGVRFTGMPAWGADTEEDDRLTWELVHFIRHLPRITPEELAEMRRLNPKSREEYEAEEAERRFLEGNEPTGAPPERQKHH